MRQLQVLVPDDQIESVVEVLDEEEVDYVRQRAWVGEEEQWLVEFPVPTDAIGHFLGRLAEAGVDVDRYTTITGLESAMTARAEPLLARFANDFDPLSEPEIRSKARDMSRDLRSFLALIALAGVIATAGLLTESFAVVVGSMVIAPIVGPVLTGAVGAVTGDREMVVHSVWLQLAGLGVAIVAAAAFGVLLRASGFVPSNLAVTGLDPIAVRVAPGMLTVAVALAAGAASAFGLATKGPTSLIGVMIAAALIPAAATVGVATVWVEPRVAVGSLLLLVLSMALINVGAYGMLLGLGYRAEGRWWRRPSTSPRRRLLLAGSTVVVVLLLVGVAAGSYQQIAYERTVNREIEAALATPEYEGVDPVAVRIEYSGVGPFASPETVTVVASLTTNGDPPQVAGEIAGRIRAATGEDVSVRFRFLEYQDSDPAGSAEAALTRPAVRRSRLPPSPQRSRLPGAAGAGSRPDPPTA